MILQCQTCLKRCGICIEGFRLGMCGKYYFNFCLSMLSRVSSMIKDGLISKFLRSNDFNTM